jgi:hypothetical protein
MDKILFSGKPVRGLLWINSQTLTLKGDLELDLCLSYLDQRDAQSSLDSCSQQSGQLGSANFQCRPKDVF